ncbi:MAG: BamA/TamA family outer membrane protein [bacterium]
MLKRKSLLVLLSITLVVPGLSLTAGAQSKSKLIRNIDIKRKDVFHEVESKPRFLYQWANSLHIVTKENVVRRMLLFKEGDRFDPDILEESERKLRALSYLGEVRLTVENKDSCCVDIRVLTQDQWSTLLSYIFSQGGGRTTLGGSVEEFNVLGFGKRIFVEARHEKNEGATLTASYTDPQLFFSRWTTEERLVTGPFVTIFSGRIIRPFYSLDTKWAGGVDGEIRDETLRFFPQGIESEESRLKFENKQIRFFAARAFGSRFKKTKLQLTYRLQERGFFATGDSARLPNDELIHALTLTTSFENLAFVKEKQIDKFVKTEDLTLGTIVRVSLGRTRLPVPIGIRRFEMSASLRRAQRVFQSQYLIFILGFQTLFERDTIASLRLQYYNRLLRNQTLAFNVEFDYAKNLEISREFRLGGDSGLRGYGARRFTGKKSRLLINLEDRIFTPFNILTVAIGGVVFLDAGNVWDVNQTIRLSDLKFSAGFGLRLGYTKSPNSRISRIDFGWKINHGGGFGVSIGIDQQFTLR